MENNILALGYVLLLLFKTQANELEQKKRKIVIFCLFVWLCIDFKIFFMHLFFLCSVRKLNLCIKLKCLYIGSFCVCLCFDTSLHILFVSSNCFSCLFSTFQFSSIYWIDLHKQQLKRFLLLVLLLFQSIFACSIAPNLFNILSELLHSIPFDKYEI